MKAIIASALALSVFAGAASAMTPSFENLTDAQIAQVESILHSGDTESEKRAQLKRFTN